MILIGVLLVSKQAPPLFHTSVLALLLITHGASKGASRCVNRGVATALSAALVAAAPLTSEAVQLPTTMPCTVYNGWNTWNGRTTAWYCANGVVTEV